MFGDFESSFTSLLFVAALLIVLSWVYEKMKPMLSGINQKKKKKSQKKPKVPSALQNKQSKKQKNN